MFDFDKVYSRKELFQIQENDYDGYIIVERNYKKNNNKSVAIDRYKVMEIMSDASIIESPRDIYVYNGIIFIEMIEKNK